MSKSNQMNKNSTNPQKRKLKIQYFGSKNVYRLVKFVPQLILRGNWLQDAQFSIGDNVEVIVSKDFIQIVRTGKEVSNV